MISCREDVMNKKNEFRFYRDKTTKENNVQYGRNTGGRRNRAVKPLKRPRILSKNQHKQIENTQR